MNNLGITTDSDRVYIDFADFGNGVAVDAKKTTFSRHYVRNIDLFENRITVVLNDGSKFRISNIPVDSKTLVVGTVDGVVPVDLNHLYDLIKTICR